MGGFKFLSICIFLGLNKYAILFLFPVRPIRDQLVKLTSNQIMLIFEKLSRDN